jgi:hypothetical protein
VRKRFDIDQVSATQAMRVARFLWWAVGNHFPAVMGCALELASPSLPALIRRELEARIIAGECVGASEIRRARGKLKTGRPKRHSGSRRQCCESPTLLWRPESRRGKPLVYVRGCFGLAGHAEKLVPLDAGWGALRFPWQALRFVGKTLFNGQDLFDGTPL